MPTPVTTNEFLDLIHKSGLLDDATLAKLHQAELPTSPIDCAKQLIKENILTRYQAQQLLTGKYKGLRFDRLKILDRIGQGGMGAVFLCEHLSLRRKVAVKILTPDVSNDPGRKERFLREARAAASLDHPNIVQVFDLSSSGGLLYLVMEYIEGQDLQTWINKNGPMPIDLAALYISQAAAGLAHAHSKGLVHRDIKPANLLLDQNGVIKILDLGLARYADDKSDNLTEKFDRGAVLGTADYMAPEQIVASSQVDARADIYSLGVTLYALVSGKPPFGGNSTQKMIGHQSHIATPLSSLRPDIPKGFAKIVAKMMQKNPADRYQTAEEVIEALSQWSAEEVQSNPGTGVRVNPLSKVPSGRRSKISRKKKSPLVWLVPVLLLSFLLIGGGIAAAIYFGGSEPKTVVQNPPPDNENPPKKDNEPPTPKGTENPPKKDNETPTKKEIVPTKKKDPLREHFVKVLETRFDRLEEWESEISTSEAINGASDTRIPRDCLVNVWDKDAKALVGIKKFLGEPAFMMKNLQKSSVQIFPIARNLNVEAGATVGFRITYATPKLSPEQGQNRKEIGAVEVRHNNERLIISRLATTEGQWQTVEAVTIAPENMSLKIYVQSSVLGDDSLMYVRSFELFQTKEPQGQSVFANFIPNLEPFSLTRTNEQVINTMGSGDLPKGWVTNTWKQNTQATFAVEEIEGTKAIRIQNDFGNTGQIFSYEGIMPVKQNHRYRVRITYRTSETTEGNLGLRVDNGPNKPDLWTVRFRKNVSEWTPLDAIVVPNIDGKLNLTIRNLQWEAGNALLIKQIEVFELAPYE
ncbi:MAG: serine/threonine protein kinase [Gemmataceae bacterium]|jgi:serine/threonine protein kinase|nr:serine/threonine protein kinase [Gemmataceae bacterium]